MKWKTCYSTCGYCLRSNQSVSTPGHTKDRTFGPLPPLWKSRDWPSQTWDSSDWSKNPSRTPGTTRNWPPLSRVRRLIPVEDDVDQHHPTVLSDVRESATCLLDGLGLSEARQVYPDRFPAANRKYIVVRRGSWCSRRVFSTCGDCLRSTQSVSTLGHTKDRTSGPLPPRWKTSGLA